MKLPNKLWKSTIVVWTDFNPTTISLEELARHADSGDAYCSLTKEELVDPRQDPDWDGTEFFGIDDDDDGTDECDEQEGNNQ